MAGGVVITVLHTHSVSWAESVRIALESEGIEAVVLDPYSANTLGLYGSVRIAIANDEDEQRALHIIEQLRPAAAETAPSWWWHKRALLALGAAFLLIYLATSMAESEGRIALALTLSALGGLSLVTGAVFLLLGYRAERRKDAMVAQRAESAEMDDPT
jgi:hypothetical protein